MRPSAPAGATPAITARSPARARPARWAPRRSPAMSSPAAATALTCHASAAPPSPVGRAAKFTHAATDTNCSSCHNGTTATGMKTPPHIPVTGVQCSNCHANTAASFVTYTMGAAGHGAVSTSRCDSCHSGAFTSQGTTGALSTASFPNHVPTFGNDCLTCHASAASAFTSWSGGQVRPRRHRHQLLELP